MPEQIVAPNPAEMPPELPVDGQVPAGAASAELTSAGEPDYHDEVRPLVADERKTDPGVVKAARRIVGAPEDVDYAGLQTARREQPHNSLTTGLKNPDRGPEKY